MSKTVKLENRTYNMLEEIRDKRETFSQAVDRLITIKSEVDSMVHLLNHKREDVAIIGKELEKAAPANTGSNCPEVSNVLPREVDSRPA